MEIFIVYILYSSKFDKYYIGQTSNFQNRINFHNSGFVKSTKPYIPWEKVLTLEKSTRSEAMKLEKKLKNLNRQRLVSFIEKSR